MSAPAPSPPPGAPPEPPPPPPPPLEPGLCYCYECGATVDLRSSLRAPLSWTPHRLCPCCHRGFLEENPPPPLPTSPPPSPPPLPPPPPSMLFYCFECGATVDLQTPLPVSTSSPHRVICPFCQRGFLEENPPSPPPPPPPLPFSGSGSSSSSELSDDLDDDDRVAAVTAHQYMRLFRGSGYDPYDGPHTGNVDAVDSMSALQHHGDRPVVGAAFNTVLPQRVVLPRPPALAAARGGEPPAPAASIAALPTVEVAEPAAACAICKDDLPLASQARKLPCAHLYHSSCIVTWLEMHNSCPVCRFRIPSVARPEGPAPSEQDSSPTRITIRFSTSTRRRGRVHGDAALAAPVSASPTQLAQAVTGDGAGGPANSGETVSSEWPRHPESDAVMSEAREEDGFFD